MSEYQQCRPKYLMQLMVAGEEGIVRMEQWKKPEERREFLKVTVDMPLSIASMACNLTDVTEAGVPSGGVVGNVVARGAIS